MAFSKSFPKTTGKSPYPTWVEVYLTEEEERLIEEKCREDNIKIMEQCIIDAKNIIDNQELKRYQTDLINIAIALFEKISSHNVYLKEAKAKEKFDALK
jgi:hypothetical protein